MSVYFKRAWRNHIEGHAADPDEEIIVGTVKKPRTTWTVKVINVNHQSAKEYAASSSRWANGWGRR